MLRPFFVLCLAKKSDFRGWRPEIAHLYCLGYKPKMFKFCNRFNVADNKFWLFCKYVRTLFGEIFSQSVSSIGSSRCKESSEVEGS